MNIWSDKEREGQEEEEEGSQIQKMPLFQLHHLVNFLEVGSNGDFADHTWK